MRKALFDFVWGFVAFVAVLAVSFLTRQNQDIRSFVLATCVAFFGVTFLRAVPRLGWPWFTVVLVALGGIAPVITMNRLGIAFTARPFFLSYLVLSVCMAALGFAIRWLYAREKPWYGAALGCMSLVAVLVAAFVAIPRCMENRAYRIVTQEVSPFFVETLTGKSLSSEDWRGHVVVLAFWATWCTPCQTELPKIAALQAKFHDNPNVYILALNSGNHGETPAKAQAYLTKRNLMLNPAIDLFGVAPGEDSWGRQQRVLA
ncbi:MAG TPA: TlpA disulfide reductase family protein [Edaphobacter sp.]|nr:TlpA disulfide reductase family protein [Edaphobacter sp.]